MTDNEILAQIKQRLDQLHAIILGDKNLYHTGLLENFERLKADVAELEKSIARRVPVEKHEALKARVAQLEDQEKRRETIIQFILWAVSIGGGAGILRFFGVL